MLLIERSPDIDYGDPGPIGIFLESYRGKGYDEKLLESIQRRITPYTLNLAYGGADEALKSREQRAAVEAMMEESIAQQEEKRKTLQENEPPPPVENVSYNGIGFKVIIRRQASTYLPTIMDLPNEEPLYDLWDEWQFPTWHDNAFFLLAEENISTEKLELDYNINDADSIPEVNDITVLGFIFLKNVKVLSHIMGFDTDNSSALIIHGDVECPNIHLFGNLHYIGGKVTTNLVWAKYNHGELYLNGSIDSRVILADDMPVFIRAVGKVEAFINTMSVNIYIKDPIGEEWLEQPSTHKIEEVFLPEVYFVNEEGNMELKEEGPDSAVELIMQNTNLLK